MKLMVYFGYCKLLAGHYTIHNVEDFGLDVYQSLGYPRAL